MCALFGEELQAASGCEVNLCTHTHASVLCFDSVLVCCSATRLWECGQAQRMSFGVLVMPQSTHSCNPITDTVWNEMSLLGWLHGASTTTSAQLFIVPQVREGVGHQTVEQPWGETD